MNLFRPPRDIVSTTPGPFKPEEGEGESPPWPETQAAAGQRRTNGRCGANGGRSGKKGDGAGAAETKHGGAKEEGKELAIS